MVVQQPTAMVPRTIGLGIDPQARLGEVEIPIEQVDQVSVTRGRRLQSKHETLLPDVPQSVEVRITGEYVPGQSDELSVQFIGLPFGEYLLQTGDVDL